MAMASVSRIPEFVPVVELTYRFNDEAARPESRWGLPEWFAFAQVAGPALLYLPGTQVFRVPLRMGVFGLSLLGLFWCLRARGRAKVHPAWIMLVMCAGYMAIMLIHPATNTLMAGLAQIGMHVAIIAPLFWAPRYFLGDYDRLARVLTILWLLNGASVLVGIMQVRDPDRWMPSEYTSVMSTNRQNVSMYKYRAADGTMAIRPPGLGDTPGASSSAGMFVAVMALAYLGISDSKVRKFFAIVLGMAGVLVIFLTHVRSALVVVLGAGVAYSLILVGQGHLKTVLRLLAGAVLCGVCAVAYAESIGGKDTMARFMTLIEDDPLTVYEKSARMGMVTNAFDTLLVENPLGAGLGRWGMMRTYFGSEWNMDSPSIWVEVQFAAWIVDGGIVLLSLYMIAITVTMFGVAKAALRGRTERLRRWAAVIAMLSVPTIALLFSYTPFYSQVGMQFWLLIGAFHGLAQSENEQRYGNH